MKNSKNIIQLHIHSALLKLHVSIVLDGGARVRARARVKETSLSERNTDPLSPVWHPHWGPNPQPV